jgi:hypothetical protein
MQHIYGMFALLALSVVLQLTLTPSPPAVGKAMSRTLHSWQCCPSCCRSPSGFGHSASCSSHTPLYCGTLDQQSHSSGHFRARVQEVISRREMQRKHKDIKGFQRTPAFVAAVVRDVLAACATGADSTCSSQPRGGFTDVGQHTGGVPRATAWPLTRQVLQVSSHYLIW